MPFANYIYEYFSGIQSGKYTVGKWVRLIYEIIIAGLERGEYFFNAKNAWFATLQNVLDEDAAGHLLNLIQNNTARIEMLEAVLFNDITTNPFLILFDDLDGVTATGVWNAALQRIEC